MSRRFRSWSIRRKAIGALALALIPLALTVVTQAGISAQIQKIDAKLPQDRENRTRQAELLGLLVDAETGVRGYLITKDPAYLEPYEAALAAAPSLIRAIESHEQEVDGTNSFAQLSDLISRELELMTSLASGDATKQELDRAKLLMDRIRAEMDAEERIEEAQIAVMFERRESLFTQLAWSMGVALIVALLGAVLAGWLLLSKVVIRIQGVKANAERLVKGEPLQEVGGGNDEVGALATYLASAAELLRARESELRQAKEEADRANLAKSDFLSRMSHELRTPLNAILGFARLAQSEVTGEVKRDIDEIDLAGKHLLALINEVLDISMIEAGRLSMSLEAVHLAEVTEEAVRLLRPGARERSIFIDFDKASFGNAYVHADRQRLKQVILNLLSNAIKYNRDSGRVDIRCLAWDGSWTLSFTDTGPGIPESAVDTPFTPFARLGAEATDIEGTGLGLALSQSLVAAMGGDLYVESTGPKGSEFRMRLKTAAEPLASSPSVESFSPVKAQQDHSNDVTSARILQVEDNPSNIRLVARILERRPGVQLVTTQSGLEAIRLARETGPDVILLDLNLPDLSGLEVLGRLKGEPSTRNIRVVMLSADATEKQIRTLLAAGAANYLTKPIDIRLLLVEVDKVLLKNHEEAAAADA